jgi:predicted DNA-binding mobile mystery protein A
LLDRHFDQWQELRRLARPPRGWIHAIRTALGMSAATVAARLGTTAGAVTRLEQSEAAERIQLNTLRQAADALGCDLVYLLVPRLPLGDVVRDRARELAHQQATAVERTMQLEDQATGEISELEEAIMQQLLSGGRLWGAPGT